MNEPTSAELGRPLTVESPPDHGSTWDVFISYASADRDRVLRIVNALTQSGVRVWIDGSGLPAGVNYGPEIVAAIRESRAVLLGCSAAAFSSRIVRLEVALAWKHERPVVPLLLEPIPIPDDLAYWLEGTQWVEILDRPREAWLLDLMLGLRQLGIAVSEPAKTHSESATWCSRQGLPTPLTEILGRDAEVADVASLLVTHRLVTLSGPGGVGKTRLAIAAARRAAASFPDGGVFVDLAPIRDPALVVPAIAKSLGVRELLGAPTEVLSAAIGQRPLLLLLDNFEQVLEAAPEIANLLIACSQTVVLVTSRAPLAVRGERVVPVEPLVISPSTATPGELAESDPVRLFAERAAEGRPDFELTSDNVLDIAAICARLEGLPLAIELAAARIKLLDPKALLAKLESRLPLLTNGPRDLPARQQTLRGAIAWSYDLLADEEQTLFERLGVFVGGWDLAAAEAVTGIPDTRVLEGLASLVDKSVVQRLTDEDGKQRFGMLETVREYALEQLVARGEASTVRSAHAAYFLALVERSRPLLEGPERLAWLGRLGQEYPSLRAALEWTTEVHDAESALRLAGGLWVFWMARMPSSEGRHWIETALALGGDAAVRLDALYGAFVFPYIQGDHLTAKARAEELLQTAMLASNDTGIARAHIALGLVAKQEGARDEQHRHLAEALARFRQLDDPSWLALALANCGEMALSDGDLERSNALEEEALSIYRSIGLEWGIALVLCDLGDVAFAQGNHTRAGKLLAESLALSWAQRDRWRAAVTMTVLACLVTEAGNARAAARLLGAAEQFRDIAGAAVLPGLRADYAAALTRTRDVLGDEALQVAWAAGRSLSADLAVAEAIASGEEIGRNTSQVDETLPGKE
jgi:predicted ATPase